MQSGYINKWQVSIASDPTLKANRHHLTLRISQGHDEFYSKVDNLDPTEDGKAGEEPHSAADEANLGGQSHLDIPLYFIIGGCVEVDLDQLQGS